MGAATTILKNDYQIGIITALPIERAAVTAMLDTVHDKPDDFHQAPHDPNNYTWGRMGLHNVVIASLSAGVYGTTMATTTAMHMLWSFQNVRFGLMIGIGGGIPNRDIRLGDVAISQPSGVSGGVFQYDVGRAKDNEWERTDFQARPPDILLKALSKLQTEHEFQTPRAHEYLHSALANHKYWGKLYGRPDMEDRLFHPSYLHNVKSSRGTCSACDPENIIVRQQQSMHTHFRIHYGTIASGNSLVKDAQLRDWIASMEQECVCIEMEAAGLMNNFPCLVIRGICDYADSHKNDAWQRYACATAAAFSKELLSFVPRTESIGSTSIWNSVSTDPPQVHSVAHADLASGLIATMAQDTQQFLSFDRTTVNTRSGDRNDTQLHSAVRTGIIEAVSLLPRHDADIEARNKHELTPLFIASQDGHLDMVKLLIEHNANVNTADNVGYTPLCIASQNGHLGVVKLLTAHNADIAAATKHGATPLYIASQKGHLDVVKLLIAHNADIDAPDEDGTTPLYIASQQGYLDVVELLIEYNANIDAVTKGNFTPLYIASQKGRTDVVKLLVEQKARVEGSRDCESTPLQVAVWHGHLDTVKVLLNHGANPKVTGVSGTALKIAKNKGHHEILKLLKTYKLDENF